MRILLILTAVFLANYAFAQSKIESKTFERKGFIFGFSIGGGSLTLKTNDTFSSSFSTSIPNIKVG
jgi:hypothetical protein